MKTLLSLLAEKTGSLKQRFFHRPILRIRIIPANRNYSRKKWPSHKTHPSGEPMYVYEVCWSYMLIIRNTSRFAACHPELRFGGGTSPFSRLDILDHSVPIPAGKRMTLKGEYIALEECRAGENTIPSGIAMELSQMRVLLTYQNEHGQPFYTTFDIHSGRNETHRFKPPGFAIQHPVP